MYVEKKNKVYFPSILQI